MSAMLRLTICLGLGLVSGLLPLTNRATAAGPFDGTYVGQQRETRNNNSGYCHDTNRATRIVVANNVIKYSWGVPLETTVGADGSFSVDHQGMAMRGAQAMISMKGQISGGNLEADVGNNACSAHMSLKKM
jgi:hypothetical protein